MVLESVSDDARVQAVRTDGAMTSADGDATEPYVLELRECTFVKKL